MQTAEIARRFINYFAGQGHERVPSASLISSDPSVMFTIAGMVPFIPYMTAQQKAPWPRAVSVQKCIRTNDIEEVGKTPRHGTFFTMAGNFSFGDYFKDKAIAYAWELLTTSEEKGGLGFDAGDLWVTVYEEDDEAADIWRKVGVSQGRIQKLGTKTNFWSAGAAGGPAGPSSEIFFDRGKEHGVDGGPETDSDRYVEIWNLVFMQYVRGEDKKDGTFDIKGPLSMQNIDTGMGVERVAFIKQGVASVYEIDEVWGVLRAACELTGTRYGDGGEVDVRLRQVADHVRSGLMLVADGVIPSNDGRGYVLRRLLRRVVRNMHLLGCGGETFETLFSVSKDLMKDSYPEVDAKFAEIERAVVREERAFLATLRQGSVLFDSVVEKKRQKGDMREISGKDAFLLHDTYGFPIDLTLEMASEVGLKVDTEKFIKLMDEQKQRARRDAKKKRELQGSGVYEWKPFAAQTTQFVGYSTLTATARVVGIVKDDESVERAPAGSRCSVIFDVTPFFAESGGQEADRGCVMYAGNTLAYVQDVQKPVDGLFVHVTDCVGDLSVGMDVELLVDEKRRGQSCAAHSATHILHASLGELLGPEVRQAGSLNRPGYMRFDFNFSNALSDDQLEKVGRVVNDAVWAGYDVETRVLPLQEAREMGAKALFSEKYGEKVRMVDINGAWSRELCAGTHVANSRMIGLVNIVSEGTVGSGVRRIEALVGTDAFDSFVAERRLVRELCMGLSVRPDLLRDRVFSLVQSLKDADKRIAELKRINVEKSASEVFEKGEVVDLSIGRCFLLVECAKGIEQGTLQHLAQGIAERARARFGKLLPCVIVLFGVQDLDIDFLALCVGVDDKNAGVSLNARDIVAGIAERLGGKGGGKPALAQGRAKVEGDAGNIAASITENILRVRERICQA